MDPQENVGNDLEYGVLSPDLSREVDEDRESFDLREREEPTPILQAPVEDNPEQPPKQMFDTLVAALEDLAASPGFENCVHEHHPTMPHCYYLYDPNTNFRVDASYGAGGMQYRFTNLHAKPEAIDKIRAAAPNMKYTVKLEGNLDACIKSAKLLVEKYGAENLTFAYSNRDNPGLSNDFEAQLKAALPDKADDLKFASPPHHARRLR